MVLTEQVEGYSRKMPQPEQDISIFNYVIAGLLLAIDFLQVEVVLGDVNRIWGLSAGTCRNRNRMAQPM